MPGFEEAARQYREEHPMAALGTRGGNGVGYVRWKGWRVKGPTHPVVSRQMTIDECIEVAEKNLDGKS